MKKITLLCIGVILGQTFIQGGGVIVKASQQELPIENNIEIPVSSIIDNSQQELSVSQQSVIDSTWGTAPVSFDETTGILSVFAGEISPGYGEYLSNDGKIPTDKIKEIIFEPGATAPGYVNNLFSPYLSNLITVKGDLDTSKVTDMTFMFNQLPKLSSVDASSWDTSNVTLMVGVFYLNQSLTSINVSGWNTSNVTSMQAMFLSAPVKELNLSSWDTGRVSNTSMMFSGTSLNTLVLGEKSIFRSRTSLGLVDTTTGVYSGAWERISPQNPTSLYENSTSFMANYDGSAPGTYVWQKNKTNVVAKDSTLYVGDTWKPEDNFISAMDPFGNLLSFADVTLSGTVDTSKAGVYPITYTNGSVSQTVNVTVLDKADLSTIKAKDSTLNVGDTWKAEDNFVSATDPTGKSLSILDIIVTGSVDTSKPGAYPITYTNGSVNQTINVTVLDKTIKPSTNSKPSDTSTLMSEKIENKKLPTTGDSNSSWFISILGVMLIISVSIFSVLRAKKEK